MKTLKENEFRYIEYGRKRIGIKYICAMCNSEFISSPLNRKKYCSQKCARLCSRNRIKVECFNCKKDFEKVVSHINNTKHGLHFCSRKCKDFQQSLKGNSSGIRPPHYGTSIIQYRRLMEDQIVKGCNCGIKNEFMLFIHHIDGDRTNNIKENLEVVCANCHVIRHLKFIDNTWIYGTSFLTPRDKIEEIVKTSIF